jgi:hypothetical protein
MRGRWRRFVEEAADRSGTSAPPKLPGSDLATRPATPEPEPEPPTPVADVAGEPIAEADRAPRPPDTGWYRLIAEATGRPAKTAPSPAPNQSVVTEAGASPTQIATKGPHRRRTQNSRRPQNSVSTLFVEAESLPELRPPTIDAVETVVEVATEIETEAEPEHEAVAPSVDEIERRRIQLLSEVSDRLEVTPLVAPVDLKRITQPAPQPAPSRIKGQPRRAEVIRHSEVLDAESVQVEVDVASRTETDPESPAVEEPQRQSRWRKFLAEAAAPVDTTSAPALSDVEVIAESDPEPPQNTPKRRRLRRARPVRRVDVPLLGAPVEVESDPPSVAVDPVGVEVDVATVTETEPTSEPFAPPAAERASRWDKLIASAPSQIDTASVDVDPIAGPIAGEPTPKRIQGRRRHTSLERQVDTSVESTILDAETAEPVAEVETPIAVEATELISDVAIEVDVTTVTETEPTSEPVAPPAPERASRWDKLVASAPSQIDTAPADADTFPERGRIEPKLKRIKGRRRHTSVERQVDTAVEPTIVEPAAELESEPVAPTVEAATEPISDVAVEVDVATVTETEPASEPVAPPAPERATRSDKLIASAPSQIDTAPDDADTPERGAVEPIAETEIALDLATLTEEDPESELVAPPAPESASRWDKLLASAPSRIDTAPAAGDPLTGPAAGEPTAKRIKGRFGRTKFERQVDQSLEATIVEPETTEPVAEIDTPIAVEAPNDVTAATTEPESEPDAPPSDERASRWNQFRASASNQINIPSSATSAAPDLSPISTPAPLKGRRLRGSKAAKPTQTPPTTVDAITENELESISADVDNPAEFIVPVNVEAVAEPAAEPKPNRTTRRVRRSKMARRSGAAPSPTLKPIQADDIKSTETAPANAGPVVDITIEPVSELVTVLPVVDTPIDDDALVEAAVVETSVEDSSSVHPGTEPVDDVNATQKATARWRRPADADRVIDAEPLAASTETEVQVELASSTEAPEIEGAARTVSELDTAINASTPTLEPRLLVDHAPEPGPTAEPDTDERVRETDAERTAPATQGRWERLLTDSAARSATPPPPPAAPKPARGRRRGRTTPHIEPEAAPVVAAGPTTTNPIVGVEAPAIAELLSETTPETDDGRWGRLIADSVARSVTPPAPTPVPKKTTKRQRRKEKAARRVELPRWVAPLESDVEGVTEGEVETVSAPPELRRVEPQPVVDRAAEPATEVERDLRAVEVVVEATESDAYAQPYPSEGRQDRLRTDTGRRGDSPTPSALAAVEAVDEGITEGDVATVADVAPSTTSRRVRRRANAARRIEPKVTEGEVQSSVEPAPESIPTAATVDSASVPLEPALLDTEIGVVEPETELGPSVERMDPVVEAASELVLEPPSDVTDDRWRRLVGKAGSDRPATPEVPVRPATEATDVQPEEKWQRQARSRWLRRASADKTDSAQTLSPESTPAAAGAADAAEATIEIASAAEIEVSSEGIVREPSWNDTEDQWRRLVSEAGSGRSISSSAADAEIDIIVPALTPAETTGRWRRLVAEAAQSTDIEPGAEIDLDVVAEAALVPPVIDLTSEPSSRPVVEVGHSAATEIERLPRVGGDLRVMINALRRKTHQDVDEDGAPTVESDALAVGSSAANLASGDASAHRGVTVDALVRTSDGDDDPSGSGLSDRRREG